MKSKEATKIVNRRNALRYGPKAYAQRMHGTTYRQGKRVGHKGINWRDELIVAVWLVVIAGAFVVAIMYNLEPTRGY